MKRSWIESIVVSWLFVSVVFTIIGFIVFILDNSDKSTLRVGIVSTVFAAMVKTAILLNRKRKKV